MISVVIPVHNGAETIGECLEAIGRSDYRDYEVVVVDDASTDNTAEVAARYPCQLVRLERNVGAATAKNIGARKARGDIILFTDDDILLQPDTLRLVAEDFSDPRCDGVVGLLSKDLRYPDFPAQFKNLWMHYTYIRLANTSEAGQNVGVFYTSLAAIRREAFEALGGFDEHYCGASVTEDIEFGQRLMTAGYRIFVDRRLTVEHLKRYTLLGLLREDLQRASGLMKTWLRKRLGNTGQRYYASVPWFFALAVPLSYGILLFAFFGLLSAHKVWWALAGACWLGALICNAPFLGALYQARGLHFLVKSCLFLPLDLLVSGMGIVLAILDFMRGKRY
ncbi:MAG: glycosyltransferase family 2 protein [Chloroflexi bacterium]|nr:glycosyltransferase family 2 protein [Chloroflexota bacterium]